MAETQPDQDPRQPAPKQADIPFCVAIACGALVFVAVFVWPTPYAYQTISTTRGDYKFESLYRVNRFTGDAVKIADAGPPDRNALPGASKPQPESPQVQTLKLDDFVNQSTAQAEREKQAAEAASSAPSNSRGLRGIVEDIERRQEVEKARKAQ